MSAFINSSFFNVQTITSNAQSTPAGSISNGVPTGNSVYGQQVIDAYHYLKQKNYTPQDAIIPSNDFNFSINGLDALCISIESINKDEPIKSFLTDESKTPMNTADAKSNMQKKNYGDDTFPDKSDPIYEMDEAPPDFIKNSAAGSQASKMDPRIIVHLFYNISIVNMDPNMNNNFKMSQFMETN